MTTDMHQPSQPIDNLDRALMVAPLVDLFANAYYNGIKVSEPLATVVQDMITDLLHFHNQLNHNDDDDTYAEQIVDDALQMFFDELAEQAMDEATS